MSGYVSRVAPWVSFVGFGLLILLLLVGLPVAVWLLCGVLFAHFVVCFVFVRLYPLKFAAFVGGLCVLGSLLGLWWLPAGLVFAGFGLSAAFLRVFFNFCLGCWVFNHTPLVRIFVR